MPRMGADGPALVRVAAEKLGIEAYHATGKRIRDLPITLEKLL